MAPKWQVIFRALAGERDALRILADTRQALGLAGKMDMTTSIEQRFAELGETSSGGRLLRAQWEYDKRLITSALGTISNHFPHYSQHDASHSETILNRIASILGPAGIAALSVSDLWLLLESAFLHDAGMVVLDIEKRGDLASPEFTMFLRETLNGTDKEMAGIARRMLDTSVPASALSVHDRHQLLIPLYAEYVRRRHAERAERAVLDPMTTLAAPSPRAWLIPNRLWRAIARISTAHGKEFEYALSLPHRELGLTTDYCHPRFVACMLRLGDLLDLDSGRFCPSVNAQLSRMPTTSVAHQRKHEGIEHFVVSPERIEVEAEYTDADAYFEAEKWFAWLREELTAQTLNWSDIAPTQDFGRLPMAGKIQARLRNQILLGSNSRPRLEVDREKLLAIARGANIYEGEHDVVREIVQNAIDATLLRYSYDCQSEGRACASKPDAIRGALVNYPIDVTFERDPRDPVNYPNRWVFTVKDRGIGMTRDDIARMLSVGSPKTSRARTQLLDWLPEWARPSGAFGIGFNSLFQYCIEVRVETKHAREHEAYRIDFTKETIEDDPRVVVTSERWDEVTVPRTAGTIVTAYFEIEPIPRSIFYGPYVSVDHRVLSRFDPLLDKEMPLALARVHNIVKSMAQKSICRLRFAHEELAVKEGRVETRFFFPEAGVELSLKGCSLTQGEATSYYRGTPVPDATVGWKLLSVEVDILSGDAPDLLQLSRRDWTSAGYRALYKKINDALPRATAYWLDCDTVDAEKRGILQFYAALTRGELDKFGAWHGVSIAPEITLGNLATAHSVKVRVGYRNQSLIVKRIGDQRYEIELVKYAPSAVGWLAPLLQSNFSAVELAKSRQDDLVYSFARSDTPIADIKARQYAGMMHDMLSRRDMSTQSMSRRGPIPCPDRFANLRSVSQRQYMYWDDKFFPCYAVSPFLRFDVEDSSRSFLVENLDAYVTRVAIDNNRTPAQVFMHLSDLFHELGSSDAWCEATGLSLDKMMSELKVAKRKLSLE